MAETDSEDPDSSIELLKETTGTGGLEKSQKTALDHLLTNESNISMAEMTPLTKSDY